MWRLRSLGGSGAGERLIWGQVMGEIEDGALAPKWEGKLLFWVF